MFNRFVNLFLRYNRHASQARRSRLALEFLEGRITPAPATLLWVAKGDGAAINVNTSWVDMGSGMPATPKAGDSLVFDPSAMAGGKQGANTAPAPLGGFDIQNLTLGSKYTKEVDFKSDTNIKGNLLLAGGTLNTQLGIDLTFPNATSTVTWSGGNWYARADLGSPGVKPSMTINNTNIVKMNGTIVDFGTITWTGSAGMQWDNASIFVENGGRFDIQTDQAIAARGAANKISVSLSGVLVKSRGSGTTTIAPDLSNSGQLLAQSGYMHFTGNAKQTEGTTLLNGGNLSFPNSYTINGGTLLGVGTILGRVDNLGGTVHPGMQGAGGNINIDSFTQGAGGTFAIDVTGGGAGQIGFLNVPKTVVLGGTLSVTRAIPYKPPVGTVLNFMKWGTNGLFGNTDFGSKNYINNVWNAGGINGLSFVASQNSPFYQLTVPQPPRKAPAAGGMTSSLNPSTLGQAVTFTASVLGNQGTPSGTVAFYDDTTLLGTATLDSTGTATFTTASLAAGDHPVTAVYSGDQTYGGTITAPVDETVNQSSAPVTLSADNTPAYVGQAVTFTATVSSTNPNLVPTGSVTFYDGATASPP
jgi:hypothetical protein